jgi:hypothetical protein
MKFYAMFSAKRQEIAMSSEVMPQTQNLTRFVWESLENISCYDSTDFMVVCTFTLHTNFQVLKVWEGQEKMRKFNRMGHSSWGQRLMWQESDGLIKREFTKGELYLKKLRQNYHLILPPKKYESCEDWTEHYYGGSHQQRVERKKTRGKDKNYTNEHELPDNFNEQLQEYQDFQDRLLTGNLNPLDKVDYYDQI